MQLPQAKGQTQLDPIYDASGSIASNTLPQLVLPMARGRSMILIQNLSTHSMWFDFGTAKAHCAITSGAVSSVTVDNAGFNFTYPPVVEFLGGGLKGFDGRPNTRFLGGNVPNYDGPTRPARAHAVLSGSSIGSIVIDDPGAGYGIAPYVWIHNDVNDPYGATDPSQSSGNGILLASGSAPLILNGTMCPTDPLAVFCGTADSLFTVKWMP